MNPPNSKKIFVCLIFCAILALLMCENGHAGTSADEEAFFSYERFFLNQDIVDNIAADGKTRKDLKAFAASFTDGIYAISSGKLTEAKNDLLQARETWPEYFGTDFLLALVYEKGGDHRTAARYYKSYLKKLKAFHAGMYRISGPLIRSLTTAGIERYDPARELIKEHLVRYGIRLARVRPVFTLPRFLVILLLSAAVAGIYITAAYGVLPYLKRQHRLRNPPEGFWVCRYCGAYNSELNRECEECGRPRVVGRQ